MILLALALCLSQIAPLEPAVTEDAREKVDMARDVKLGEHYAEQVMKEYKASEDKAMIERVNRIGAEIAAIAKKTHAKATWGDQRLNPFHYTYHVIKGKDINAFSLPGGYIYVFEGLLNYIESDDELAGVLAHETAHAAFRHVAVLQHEEAKVQSITLPLVLLSILAGGANSGAEAMQVGNLVGMAKGSGWSLKAELAADEGGFQYLEKSRYNPTAMLTLMERLARDERNGPQYSLGILQSHPPSKERAQAFIKLMTDAHMPIKRSAVSTSLRAVSKTLDGGAVEIWYAGRKLVTLGGLNAANRAEAALPKLNAFFDATPELYEVKADDNQILYRGDVLFDLTQEDAGQLKETPIEAAKTTLEAIRGALFALAFRTWDR
jgi:beta-barrel assembly-enhancing protease